MKFLLRKAAFWLADFYKKNQNSNMESENNGRDNKRFWSRSGGNGIGIIFSAIMTLSSVPVFGSWIFIVVPEGISAEQYCGNFVPPEALDYYATGSHPACNWGSFEEGLTGTVACQYQGKFYGSFYCRPHIYPGATRYMFLSASQCNLPKVIVDGQCVDQKCPEPYRFSLESGLCEAHCATGETWSPVMERCVLPPEEQRCETQSTSPIDFIKGRKYRSEPVLSSGIRYPFSLTYYFNNQRNQERSPLGSRVAVASGDRYLAATKPAMTASEYQTLYTNRGIPIGGTVYLASQHYGSVDQYWRHNFDEILQIHGNQYLYQHAKGHEVVFGGFGASAVYPHIRLQALASGEESFAGYKLRDDKSREVRKFDSNGRLIKIQRSSGDILVMTYDSQNRLERVTNSEGAYIQLAYQELVTDSIYRTTSIGHSYPISATNNRGESAQIAWGKTYQGKTGKFHLITQITEVAAGPAQSARIFEYNDTRWPASVTDQYFVADIANGGNRKKLLHFEYDDLGRAIFSGLNGRPSDSVAYIDADTRVVTNALGKQATYKFADFDGIRRLQSVTGEPTQNCVSSEVSYEYDANGNVIRKIQNGQITEYQYDSQNREISRTEAVGTSDARAITTEYHSSLDVPIRIAEPGRIETLTYDKSGRLLSKNIQPVSAPSP